MEQNVLFAFLLTLLAGLATGIGGLIALFAKRTNKSFLSFSLGLSAGVMIYVSFVELLRQAEDLLTIEIGKQAGLILTATCFFLGMLFIAIIDKLVPSHENPHEMRSIESMHTQPPKDQKLMKMGIITAIAITIHNFPEGIAIFISAMENPSLGISLLWLLLFIIYLKVLQCQSLFFMLPAIRKNRFIWHSYRD